MSSLHRRWLLTGGIGSGKSEARKLLAERGVRTIDADAIGHSVLAEEARDAVAERWPHVVLEGQIDRKALAQVVFADRDELVALETITHPLIFGRIEAELEGFSGIAVVEMPLIDNSLGWARMVVDADDETRVGRAIGRGMVSDDVRRRMASQPTRAQWLAAADLVIPNHGTLQELKATIDELAEFLLV